MEPVELKRIIEALLFVAEKPLEMEDMREVTGEDSPAIKAALSALAEECDVTRRGFRLKEIAGAYQFVTDPDLAGHVKAYAIAREKKKLSGASLETLSVIAYRQPVTRQEIEYIRGVNVDGAIKTLLEKGIIRITGRKEVPGRPMLYGTTKEFLDHFGLGGLKDLPKLAEFTEKDIELPESLKAEEPGAPDDAAVSDETGAADPEESQGPTPGAGPVPSENGVPSEPEELNP